MTTRQEEDYHYREHQKHAYMRHEQIGPVSLGEELSAAKGLDRQAEEEAAKQTLTTEDEKQ